MSVFIQTHYKRKNTLFFSDFSLYGWLWQGMRHVNNNIELYISQLKLIRYTFCQINVENILFFSSLLLLLFGFPFLIEQILNYKAPIWFGECDAMRCDGFCCAWKMILRWFAYWMPSTKSRMILFAFKLFPCRTRSNGHRMIGILFEHKLIRYFCLFVCVRISHISHISPPKSIESKKLNISIAAKIHEVDSALHNHTVNIVYNCIFVYATPKYICIFVCTEIVNVSYTVHKRSSIGYTYSHLNVSTYMHRASRFDCMRKL